MNWWGLGTAVLCASLSAACTQSDSPELDTKANFTISAGREVSLEYTLRLDDSEVYDTNVGSDPLTYTHGRGHLVSGLEAELEGMALGERKHVTVPPPKAYGDINPLHLSEVPKELIPPDARKIGTQLQAKARHGQAIMMQVREIKEETIVMDFNHPLAGKTLHFDVKVVAIQ